MNSTATKFSQILMGTLLMTLVACGGKESSPKNSCDTADGANSTQCNLTQEQKDEAARKAKERKEISEATRRKMLIQHHSVSIVDLSETNLTLRLGIKINNRLRPIILSLRLDKNLPEQFDYQDRTSDIENIFPNHNLEVKLLKFKAGNVDVMSLEYNLLRYTEVREESASQFVLMLLDKNLGNKAVIKTHFELPTSSNIRNWGKQTSRDLVETP